MRLVDAFAASASQRSSSHGQGPPFLVSLKVAGFQDLDSLDSFDSSTPSAAARCRRCRHSRYCPCHHPHRPPSPAASLPEAHSLTFQSSTPLAPVENVFTRPGPGSTPHE